MHSLNWRRLGFASLLAIPVGGCWFANLVLRDVDPSGWAVSITPWVALALVLGGPALAAVFWRASGLAGAVAGAAIGTLAAWPAYRLVAPSLSTTPVSEYELGWTSFAAGVYVVIGIVVGLVALAVGAALRSGRRQSASP